MRVTLDNIFVKAKGASPAIDSELAPFICSAARIPESSLQSYRIIKRSIDARQKPDVKLLYKIEAEISGVPGIELARPPEATVWQPPRENALKGRTIIVVGAGPAGLFAALVVAMAGGNPVILDRGRDVDGRRADIDAFMASRQLNPESNFLFGEGGAGTWSDGKLFTRVNDCRIAFMLQQFVECGAQPQIKYFAHPHIGSDKLPGIIAKLRNKIITMGGEFRWNTAMSAAVIEDGVCRGIQLSSGEIIKGDGVIVACGHSARDLISTLIGQGVAYQGKGFQLGMRIEHPQEFINRLQYGVPNSYSCLGAAEYNIVSKPSADGRITGVTSFCMCPGGEIIPATSDQNHLCSNGMSNSGRDGKFANSALIATMNTEDFGDWKSAYTIISDLEAKSFAAGGGDYTAPAQNALDFLKGKTGRLPTATSYKLGLANARLDKILPRKITDAIRHALKHFDKIHPGFSATGTFVGIETRVSSPVRFLRNPATGESSVKNLYFAGEGAGMAGGITSAAVDGMKMAEAIVANLP